MVQFFETGPSRKGQLAEILGQSLGEGLGNFAGEYFANRSLDSVLKDKSLKDAPVSERLSRLETALRPHGERGQKILQNRLMIEQQQMQEQEQAKSQEINEAVQSIVEGKELTPKQRKIVPPEVVLKAQEVKNKKAISKNIFDSLVKAGYPEETARLWQNQMDAAPTGGQSDVIKQVNDLIRRSKTGKGIGGEQDKVVTKPAIDIPGLESQSFELDFPELPEPINLTPADMVKQNEAREKVNTPVYTETVDRLNALDEEFRDLATLQQYNDIPEALPSGLEKWNVDWETGDLRFKGLASPEAQDYVKTIARMARKAKDFFPGRVTNFDLDQFKAGFPTLANTPEGRQLIIKQLSLGNRIAYLKDETLKAAIDHYGSGADPVLIKKYATENYRKLKGQLEQQLKTVNQEASGIVNAGKPFERMKVPPGTRIDDATIDKYLRASNKDPIKAQQMAEEDGYTIE